MHQVIFETPIYNFIEYHHWLVDLLNHIFMYFKLTKCMCKIKEDMHDLLWINMYVVEVFDCPTLFILMCTLIVASISADRDDVPSEAFWKGSRVSDPNSPDDWRKKNKGVSCSETAVKIVSGPQMYIHAVQQMWVYVVGGHGQKFMVFWSTMGVT